MKNSNRQYLGLLFTAMLVLAHIQLVSAKLQVYEANQAALQADPTDYVGYAKTSVEVMTNVLEALEDDRLKNAIGYMKNLSLSLGVAGALVGFIFSFFGGSSGPDPEILKLQEMIKQTQTLIALGNQDILNAIRKLNSDEARRQAQTSMTILETLVRKHMIDGHEYDRQDYSSSPCGPDFTICNNAFTDLCNRLDDILAASHDDAPRGDLKRVRMVADNIIKLLTNSMYSLSWLNAHYYNETHPATPVNTADIAQVRRASQADTIEYYYKERAIATYERWTLIREYRKMKCIKTINIQRR